MSLSPDVIATLEKVTTATITTMLLKKGIRHCWMRGAMPFSAAAGKRLVGPAFTLRFVPVREDLATPASWGKPAPNNPSPTNGPGTVMVIEGIAEVYERGLDRKLD